MESFLQNWLRWPIIEHFMGQYSWAWPLAEVVHFVGLILLVGIVGMLDLRLLGLGKQLPVAPLRRLLPWGVFGFVLVVASGGMFVTGMYSNISIHPYTVITSDGYLQLKLLFIFLAGLNLAAFYVSGMARVVDRLGAGDDAPPLAKAIAGASLFLWIGVIYFGRLIPWGDFGG